MGFICTMIAETKLLAIKEGCDIDMNDRGSKVLEEFFLLGRNGLCEGTKKRQNCKMKYEFSVNFLIAAAQMTSQRD